ncbi:MAG TPA: phosphoribosylanthranilate isomerase [Chloroflexota bacterium]|nr:phosphoribosylanthranilate isomerase [Chloroflexota bacterium]
MSRTSDVTAAEVAGADFIGLVIEFERSPRSVSVETGATLARASNIPAVAVLVDPTTAALEEIIPAVLPFGLQLAGTESPERVTAIKSSFPSVEIWKVLHLRSDLRAGDLDSILAVAEKYRLAGADRLMFDAAGGKLPGGTGRTVDWAAVGQIVHALETPVILAGGLTSSNVGAAVMAVRPAGVDVSSGTESEPGIKDPRLMLEFSRAARAAFDALERQAQRRS